MATIATAVAVNARPSRSWRRLRQRHGIATGSQRRAARSRPDRRRRWPIVHTAKPTSATSRPEASRCPRLRARSARSPVVRSARNVEPCSRHSTTRVRPVQTPYAGEQVPEGAGELLVGVDGQSGQQVAERQPEHERCQQAADVSVPLHVRATARASTLPRNSKETPRMISATSSSRTAR